MSGRRCAFCDYDKGLVPARAQDVHPVMAGLYVCRNGTACKGRMRKRLGVPQHMARRFRQQEVEEAEERMRRGSSG